MGLVVVVGRCWPLLSVLGRPRDGPASRLWLCRVGPRCASARSQASAHSDAPNAPMLDPLMTALARDAVPRDFAISSLNDEKSPRTAGRLATSAPSSPAWVSPSPWASLNAIEYGMAAELLSVRAFFCAVRWFLGTATSSLRSPCGRQIFAVSEQTSTARAPRDLGRRRVRGMGAVAAARAVRVQPCS